MNRILDLSLADFLSFIKTIKYGYTDENGIIHTGEDYEEVRTWNMRAVRCYEKAGFHIIGEPIKQTTPIGEGTFFHMVAD